MLPYITLSRFVFTVFPKVKNQLETYKDFLKNCPSPELKKQALRSIEDKEFHCLGGNIYSVRNYKLIPFITAFQTISDYLDNLCDRNNVTDEEAFRKLHNAMLEVFDKQTSHNFYEKYPQKSDGGYLDYLVDECMKAGSTLPSFSKVKKDCYELTTLYVDLQSLKHLDPNIRKQRLIDWHSNQSDANNLFWWEFAASTGSTLTTFALMLSASSKDLSSSEIKAVKEAYFPWISGLHILLDYFVDQQEDKEEGDLNFVSFYPTEEKLFDRMKFFIKKSMESAYSLKNSEFHTLVVRGLLAMYLSDPKIEKQNLKSLSNEFLSLAGQDAHSLHKFCVRLRKHGKI
ncbi:tetraprenyl-beta-curcumene synthase family protein [Proteinivorax hydrogeniformans]|uniref:Tetraprenyl-beta-curcumene synthase family protein n=1 Tax=Proteinivorax hydrogeniformans TaxID=1826727 RepID=A0AAU8HQU3_9FIRM